jgi:hypothetical protein
LPRAGAGGGRITIGIAGACWLALLIGLATVAAVVGRYRAGGAPTNDSHAANTKAESGQATYFLELPPGATRSAPLLVSETE